MAIVFIGIGSNMGDRQANCLRAVDLLGAHGLEVRKVSSLYETEPWGLAKQRMFINAALEAVTGLSPADLLAKLKVIEKDMGREKTEKWGPRIIDLDILFYDNVVIKEAGLEIPHPLLHKRGFVLLPLAEIAPDKRHPATGITVMQLKEGLRDHENA
jgi:2-amino-4-hydroxy-6-hydroxymethyldihydropteridine diphosphokinase